MKIDFLIEETVKARHSVRTYQNRPLTAADQDKISTYIAALANPFAIDVNFHLLEKTALVSGEKLGTYGVIKGASNYVGASVAPGELVLEALGYSFEQLVLYCTSLGLGTCWLGGTFDRSGFSTAMKLKAGDLFPVISPLGYPAGKKRMLESVVQWAAKSNRRCEWSEIFYDHDFTHPLTPAAAGDYAFPLEMLRLAPSAVNKQPWRIVQDQNAYHFYEVQPTKDSKLGIDIQRTDVGIGACHFHLAAMESALPGSFEKLKDPGIQATNPVNYLFSWIRG
ncbi:nitroreductase family protein [Acetobacterium woodii]|uniref:Putative nitroreductase Nfs n=1 Tax=Acetobacterium woodii (strain ATCC 29683 / DSM 1030 / JCM 2381 / KCTC 1655 / WB1) TaxID=931626 RepID=H6LKW5_ACEWD|nr:nitroreductase family protein [Acetobacterium woodii]AFA50074.1 putative nitroreductase Nfs [Acetobacterium woodii DSM 1030]